MSIFLVVIWFFQHPMSQRNQHHVLLHQLQQSFFHLQCIFALA